MSAQLTVADTGVRAEVVERPSAALTPLDMLNRAVERGADIDVLARLMDLHERWEKAQARKAFDAAVADAKSEITPIVRNKAGHNNKKYADFAAVATAIDPIITRHGLSYRFRTAQTDKITVTCVLTHRDGHFEENPLSGPADASGSKNAIQAIGSTLTYLQRYSLMQALGLAAKDDDDGKATGAGGNITDDQLAELRKLIKDFDAKEPAFCQYMEVDDLASLPAKRFGEAKQALNDFGRRARQ